VEQNTLSATTEQFATVKTPGCANILSNSSRAEKICAGMTDTQGLQFETLLNNTRIENAEKVRKKTFVFFAIWLLYVQLLGAEQIRACVSRTYVQSA